MRDYLALPQWLIDILPELLNAVTTVYDFALAVDPVSDQAATSAAARDTAQAFHALLRTTAPDRHGQFAAPEAAARLIAAALLILRAQTQHHHPDRIASVLATIAVDYRCKPLTSAPPDTPQTGDDHADAA